MGWKNYILPPAFHSKASEVHRAIARVLGLSPAWLPRNYETFAKEGYNANVWVNRCIKAIAENAAGVPWLLYQVDSKGERKEIVQHDLLKLLNKPNEFTSRQEFIESVIAFMLISGNSYMDMVGPNDEAPPKELWALRPDRVKVVPHTTKYIAGYTYEIGSEKIRFDVKRIAHLKFFNPLDDYYGLAPIEVAARGIDNDNAANAWNNSLLTNGARPTGALVTKESLTPAQYQNVKAALDDHRGTKNAGKPLLLEGGLEWQNMSISPRDMDFISSKKMSILEICAAFGVPPEIVGYGENKTYSNYAEARKALYEDGVLPNLNRLRDKLNATLVPRFGDNLELDYNKDAIEALQENRDAVYKRATEAYKGELLTKDEAREEMGYGAAKEDGDAYYKPPTPAAMAAPKVEDEKIKSAGFFLTVKALNIESDEQKNNFWQAMENGRKTYYKKVAEKVADQFEDERKKVVEAFKNGKDIAKAIDQKEWQKLLANIYVVVMDDFGGQLMTNFKKSANMHMETKAPLIPLETIFRVFDKAVQKFIATTVAKKVVGITDVTIIKLRGLIKEGEAAGESIDQIAERIDKLYLDQIIPNRSTVIARTEVIGASNAGNSFAADQTGLKLRKEWLSTRDERTRDTHNDMDGEKVEKEKVYSNGLMFPGDPTGAAEEVIQCRCTEVYEVIK